MKKTPRPAINSERQAQFLQLMKAAADLTWQKPDVEVLRPDLIDQYPSIVRGLQNAIHIGHERGKLLLPDLEAFGNETVAIFSDYGGESKGDYHTYSFLACAWNTTGLFAQEMLKIRDRHGLGDKEIAFKDFRMGQMRRALPEYLRLLDTVVNGLLLTVVIDKRLPSFFSPKDQGGHAAVARELLDHGLGSWKPDVAEKLVRVVQIAAFLVGLLAVPDQKLFWMTDADAICANEELHRHALELFCRSLPQYVEPGWKFGHVGGASQFGKKDLMTLDLLSAADVVAGSVERFLTTKNSAIEENFKVKPGSEKVLQWLAHDGLALKKLTVIMRPKGVNEMMTSTLEFSLRDPPPDVTIVPVIV